MPKGYKEAGKVYCLKKALYRLKQLPQIWYKTLLKFLLEKLGLYYLHADYSIFATSKGWKGLIISAYINDTKIIHKDIATVNWVKVELKAAFQIIDLGPISFYLGIIVTRD